MVKAVAHNETIDNTGVQSEVVVRVSILLGISVVLQAVAVLHN